MRVLNAEIRSFSGFLVAFDYRCTVVDKFDAVLLNVANW